MPTSRTLVRSTAPAALLALALAACPRAGQKDDAALAARLPASAAAAGATGDAASIAATGRAAALLDRGSRYAVQLFAAPDRVAARDKLAELQQLGLTGIIASADLGLRGQWYRVLIGNHGRRDLAELRGRALVADPRVRALLPTPPAGDPGYVVRDDVAPPLLPGPSLAALERLAAERELAAVPIWTRGGGAPALAVIFAGDPRLRLLDATGVLGAPLPLPRFADCRECLAIAAAHRARAASVLLAEDMSGDGASELLLALDHGAGHRLAALSTADRGGQLRELGTLVLDASEQVPPSLASIELVDADGDPAAELLVVRRTPVTHEGELCDLRRQPLIYDLGDDQLVPLDAAHFARLASPAGAEGRSLLAALVRLGQERADPELVLPPALAYLLQASAGEAAEAVAPVLAFLDGLSRPDAALVRVETWAQLAAGRPELRQRLAPRLDAALAALCRQRAAPPAGCDEAPLAIGVGWSAEPPTELEQRAQAARQRGGLWSLGDGVFRSLAAAYPRQSAVGRRLEALVVALAPVESRQRVVRRLIDAARVTAASGG